MYVDVDDASKKKNGHLNDDYFQDMHVGGYNSKRHDYKKAVREVMDECDFVGVAERMEDSFVVFQMVLGLKTGDVLHVPAKASETYDKLYHYIALH